MKTAKTTAARITGTFVACILCLLLFAGGMFVAPQKSYAAIDTQLAAGQVAADGSNQDIVISTSSAKKSTKKKKKGNLDKYIGLPKYMWVIATGKTNVPIYRKAKASSRTIASFQRRSCIIVDTSKMKKGKRYKWLRVKLNGKRHGYIRLSTVKLKKLDTKTFGLNIKGKKHKRNKLRAAICHWALKWIGVRYSHGNSLKTGLHCGSFVKKCFNHKGFNLVSASVGYLGGQGKAISRKNLKPGDLAFYSYTDIRYGHVAMYIGKGLIINSSGRFGTIYPRGGVRISTVDYRSPTAFAFRDLISKK